MMKGEEIKQLIPQRNPMIMVDEFERRDDNTAHTTLTIRSDNFFLYDNGELSETGLIEHIAQSASALAGYQAKMSGATTPPVGIIGAVKCFECLRRPVNGEKLDTAVFFGFSFCAATLVHGISCIENVVVAEAQMKIFL